jgi:hypothetical protein
MMGSWFGDRSAVIGQPDYDEGQSVNEFREWESRVTPVLHAAMATLNACDRACESHWTPAMVAHADQIEAAARSLAMWLEERRCPYADLDGLLVAMARAYRYLAGSLTEMVTSESAGAWAELERDLKGVHGSVARVLTAMYRESLRQL